MKKNFEWKDCNEDNVIKFLVTEKGFNMERVKLGLKRLKDSKGKANQQRLDSFFKPQSSTSTNTNSNDNTDKNNTPVTVLALPSMPVTSSTMNTTKITGKKKKRNGIFKKKRKNKRIFKKQKIEKKNDQ